jgi:purine nucleosidase
MRKFLIDTDTASDDAVAIMMGLAEPGVRVLGLTTVAGNVGLEQATQNALLTAEICNSDVPVFMGAEKPLRGGEGILGSSQFRRTLRNSPCGHS